MSIEIRKKYELCARTERNYEQMKINQRVIRTVVAFMLVIATMLSMSSCLFVDYGTIQDIINGGDQGGGGQHNPPEKDPSTNPDDDENKDENGETTDVPDFYPGTESGNIESVTLLHQTLLSTVVVVADSYVGSGVFYQVDKEKGDAYIITNQHVVFKNKQGIKNIKIYLYGMVLESYAIEAKYIGGTTAYDIAVLKIEGSEILKKSLAQPATLGKSADVRMFDTVYAVGNPDGSGFSATQGIISVRSENLDLYAADDQLITVRVMRVDAAINQGNSGGGLYDENGKLIGIVNAKSSGTLIDNIGYAIPIDLAKNLADNIIYHCDGETMTKLNRAMLGITISAKVIGPVIDENGKLLEGALVQVMEVSNSSLAYGKVEVDDIVNSISVDGVKVNATEVYVIPEHMLTARVGSEIVMNITRGEETFDITFTITEDAITLEK